MTITTRRIIYLSFVAIFLIGSAWLILYLQGFRYNQYKGKLEKMGALMVDSLPHGASIYIDGKIIKKTTPTTVQTLSPGEYQVEISAPNLQTWKKKLTVKQLKVSFTGQVRLWPQKTNLTTISNQSISHTMLSPNRESIIYFIPQGVEQGLWYLNLTSGKTTLLDRSTGINFNKASWSTSGRKLIIPYTSQLGTAYKLFNLETTINQTFSLPSKIKINSLHWDNDDAHLLVATDNGLYRFNLNTEVMSMLINEPSIDIRYYQGLLIILTNPSDNATSIKLYNAKNLQPLLTNPPLPVINNPLFMDSNEDWLPIFNEQGHAIYLLRSPLKYQESLQTLRNVTQLDWNKSSQEFIINNNFEIWEYNPATSNQKLLSRMSTLFNRARSYLDESYIIVAQKQMLSVIEFDARDFQQQWNIGSFSSPIKDFFIDPLGKTITVLTDDGLYQIKLSSSWFDSTSVN